MPDSQAANPATAETEPVDNPGEWVDSIEAGGSSRVTGPFGKTFVLELKDGVRTSIAGWIDAPGEVMTYDVGEVFPGDQLVVEVNAVTEGFDPAVAVFDADQNWLDLNDDRHYYDRRLDPYVQFVCREYRAQCYVVVSSSVRSDTTGGYELHVTRTPNVPYDAPHGQIVYLNFEGAKEVVIGRRDPVDVPPFSGDMIAPRFVPYTDELISRTVQRVRDDYAGYEVTIIGSNEQDPPATPHTTVHYGSYNPALLGIADSVDTFNQRQIQEAIIFVDTFSVFMSQDPTVEEMSNALANVASHEIGHLLGLHHTADAEEIMDISAGLRQMLAPQSFHRAALNGDTFAVGYQDSPRLLLQNVGGDEAVLQAAGRAHRAKHRDPWYDEGPQIPARSYLRFSSGCSCR